jgi:branched-chain amino acid transport system permease protein
MTRRLQGSRGRRLLATAASAVALAAVYSGPQYLSLYNVVTVFTLFTYIAMAQAWNLIGGFGGQFSLGHAMFVGIGSYATALLLIHTGLPLWSTIVIAGLIATGIAMIAALPLLRLRNVYFAVGSLGVSLAALSWMINWQYTGKTAALNLPTGAFLSFTDLYYAAGSLAVCTTAVVALLVKTRYGLRLMAVRDDEEAAAELGVGAFAVKLVAFAGSAFFVGVAGSLVAIQKLSLEPYSAFSLTFTINMIIMTVVGGLGTIVGPIIGSVLIFELQQQLQNYQDWSTLITGGLLVVIIRFAPGGLWGAACSAVKVAFARSAEHLQADDRQNSRVRSRETPDPDGA